jgi:hypothetical protein
MKLNFPKWLSTRMRLGSVAAATCALAGILSACGGGGSSEGAGGLSSAQKNAEAALDSGYCSLSWYIPAAGVAPVSGTNYLYSTKIMTPASVSTGLQSYLLSAASLTTALAVPDLSHNVTRVVKDGQVYARSGLDKINVYFSGSEIVFDAIASDGATVVSSAVYDRWSTPIALGTTDTLRTAPDELKAAEGLLTRSGDSNFNLSRSWEQGSAYIKVSSYRRGDTLFALDWSGQTYGSNINGSNFYGTLEQFFSALLSHTLTIGPVQYTIADGTISTVSGVRAWVAKTPAPASAHPTTSYYALFESNGMIYLGYLERGGTRIRRVSAIDSTILLDYSVRLNDAAIDSIKQGLNF